MNIKKLFLIASLVGLTASPIVNAGSKTVPPVITTTGSGSNDVNRGYVGLKWTLGEGTTPAVIIGYRHARVESNGDTDGGDVSFSFNLVNGFKAGKLRTKYFNGKEDLQGEVGVGYDFAHGLFVGAGAKAPYSNLGVDYLFSADSSWQPYFVLDTLKKYDKPNRNTTLTCPDSYILNGGSGLCETLPPGPGD